MDDERLKLAKTTFGKAYAEYEIFNKTQPIESDFDRVVKGISDTHYL